MRCIAFLITHGADLNEHGHVRESGILCAVVMALTLLKTVQLIAERMHSEDVINLLEQVVTQ
jgi:hypothetical protein